MISEIYRVTGNAMMSICELTDKSFFLLFVFYMIIYSVWSIILRNIELFLKIEQKVYLYDLVILFVLFVIFAYNTYWLHKIKVSDAGHRYYISKYK
jgi:Ca2+/Na+ antiporter